MPELALAWVLRRDELAAAIVGASRPEQVHANAAASGIELSRDVLQAIDDALADIPVRGQNLGVFATEGVTHRSQDRPLCHSRRGGPLSRPESATVGCHPGLVAR